MASASILATAAASSSDSSLPKSLTWAGRHDGRDVEHDTDLFGPAGAQRLGGRVQGNEKKKTG
ncbi:hypothetical protein, partial [Nonomuraea rubra]|uniref:hypothetical protein n=1 Tax=Nonomuraea rubra TaxID=46180 RepID=UPI0031EFCF66